MSAEIGDRTRNGLYEITDTAWDSNGTMRVTVREMVGVRRPSDADIRAMRRLARRALSKPHLTRSSRVLRVWYSGGQSHVTFAVSRLDR